MKAYYRELMKFVPHPIQIAEREDLRHLWKLEPYTCLSIFEDFYECFQNAPDIRTAFFKILPIEEIYIKNGGLIFSIGYKNTYPAGIEMSDLDCEDPRVKYQTHENGIWFNSSLIIFINFKHYSLKFRILQYILKDSRTYCCQSNCTILMR